jgi:hypothetical protein
VFLAVLFLFGKIRHLVPSLLGLEQKGTFGGALSLGRSLTASLGEKLPMFHGADLDYPLDT